MRIHNRLVGPEYPPLVIAEIGINHGGDLTVAKRMIELAAHAGAEVVKHQTHFIDDEMTPAARGIFPPNDPRPIWDVIADSALSPGEEIELKRFAEAEGLIYLSTPFSRSAASFLDGIGVPAFKIGSGELSNVALLRHICGFGKPVIVSTGMHSVDDVAVAVDICRSSGVEYALLECTNLYPSPPECVSLRGVLDLQQAFPEAVIGFSDHSIGPYMALAAVAVGASIIERHFTDSRYRHGPDITASMDPAELRLIVDRSREVWLARRNPKQRSSEEDAVFAFARSSVVADRELEPGTVLSEADLWARRPGNGEIPGSQYDSVVGRTLLVRKAKNDFIAWSDLG